LAAAIKSAATQYTAVTFQKLPFLRAQHRFGGMRDESKREGEIQDDKTFNGEMQAKRFSWCGMVLKLTAGCGMENGKSHVTGAIEINILTGAGWPDRGKNSGRIRD